MKLGVASVAIGLVETSTVLQFVAVGILSTLTVLRFMAVVLVAKSTGKKLKFAEQSPQNSLVFSGKKTNAIHRDAERFDKEETFMYLSFLVLYLLLLLLVIES